MDYKPRYLLTLFGVILLLYSVNLVSANSDTGSDEVIRGYYIWVTDVSPVGDVVLGQNVTLEVTIEYNFFEVPLVPTIIDHNNEIRAKTSDTIQGYGNKTYAISMQTSETDDTAIFAVIAYYNIEGNWTYMDPNGYMVFTLGQDDTGSSDDIESADGLDLSNLDMDLITSSLNDTIQMGLDLLDDVEIPDEISDIEDTIKEQTGIPSFPVGAMILGAAILVAYRRRC